jgi:1,2-diacylglycerol 3-beta-galactosyltransferase
MILAPARDWTVSRPESPPVPVPLLFLIADSGGGHRAAARAVSQALEEAYPGRFAPVFCDPLTGPDSARLLRWITGRYGSLIRRAPWIWAALYYGSDSRAAMNLLHRTLFALANRPVADAVARHRPAAILSFHPLISAAAVTVRERAKAFPRLCQPGGTQYLPGTPRTPRARNPPMFPRKRPREGGEAFPRKRFLDGGEPEIPVVTVVTDLVTLHTAWRFGKVDRIVTPETGLPVTADFRVSPAGPAERLALRRRLGLSGHRFVVLLAGGAEGCGGIAKRAAALITKFPDIEVVAVCGRNRRLKRKLDRRLESAEGRLHTLGFAANMADWLRCADIVVTKAGPGTIAEATATGAPLIITSHLPGQERGNTELVVSAGAGRHAPSVQKLVREIAALRHDPAALAAMRAASARLGRPGAAAGIAALLAEMTG